MTVSNTYVKQIYSGNDVTTTFAIPFSLYDNAQIKVILVSSTGVETVQTLTTHYTIVSTNVEMVTAPATGEKLVVLRASPLTQTTDYIANGPFYAEDHEAALDKLMMQVQELDERMDRAPKYKVSSTIDNLEMTVPVADDLIIYNAAGTGITSITRTAASIPYDNTTTGLTAVNVQTAIDEVEAHADAVEVNYNAMDVRVTAAEGNISALTTRVDTAESDIDTLQSDMSTAQGDITDNATAISDHISDATAAHAASAISVDPTGLLVVTTTDVQSAIAELDAASPSTASGTLFSATAEITSLNVQDALVEVEAKIPDDAGDVSFTSSGSIVATDVAAALDEVNGNIPADAGDVSFTSGGSIVATDVEAALDEVNGNIITDHGGLSGLADDDHTQYAAVAGRAGGQTIQGGTAASEDLTLESTAHATKGKVVVKANSPFSFANPPYYVDIKPSASQSESYEMYLPPAQGASGQYMANDGTGILTWATPGGTRSVVEKTADYTLADNDVVLCNNTTDITLTLPAAASSTGKHYTIVNINTGKVIIDGNSAELISGQLTQVIQEQFGVMRIICDGTAWYII